eukprot:29112-Pelagococcus_subviridis.AAC.6
MIEREEPLFLFTRRRQEENYSVSSRSDRVASLAPVPPPPPPRLPARPFRPLFSLAALLVRRRVHERIELPRVRHLHLHHPPVFERALVHLGSLSGWS